MRFQALILFVLYCNNYGAADIVNCVIEGNEMGQCTLASLCEGDYIDERQIGDCLSDEVCCPMPEKTSDPTTTNPPSISTTTPVTTTEEDDTNQQCGLRKTENMDAIDLRSFPEDSSFAETTWTALVFKKGAAEPNYVFISGGSLIHPKVVMTTIHRIKKLKGEYKLKVRLGEYNMGSTDERLPYQERDVLQTVMHESFQPRTHVNNIGLLILESPVNLVENVGTICLPPSDFIPSSENECFFTGWGAKEFKKGEEMTSLLKLVDVPIIEREQCQESLRKTRLGQKFNLSESALCAGGKPGYDSCTNDGGSPLVCLIPNMLNVYMQVGMVSWGIGCNNEVPGVYVNIPHLRFWIDENFLLNDIE